MLTSKDGDLPTYFDKIMGNKITNISLKELLIDNHTAQANNGKTFRTPGLEHILRFCKTFKMITKGLGFNLTVKTADLQNIAYTTLPVPNVHNINIHLFVPMSIPSPEHYQNSSTIKNCITFFFDC